MKYSGLFVHSEWTDICIYDKYKIKRTSVENEIGKYKVKDNEIIINWNNWEGDDIFIKIHDDFIHKTFYDENIKNYNLSEINIQNNNIINIYILNIDKNIIFKKNDLKFFGYYIKNDNNISIKQNNGIEKMYIKIANIYYEQDYLISLIKNEDKINLKKEKFKKIDNNYFLNHKSNDNVQMLDKINNIIKTSNLTLNIKNEILKLINVQNIDNEYNISDININNNKINQRLNSLIENNDIINKNYLNINNIKEHLNINIDENVFNNIIKLNLSFKIDAKKNKRILSLVQWGYPPFGGGENWILNMNKILKKYNYETYLICFSDPFRNEYYCETKMIDLEYVKVIQTPYDLLNIIKLIKLINPDIINHQGVNRLEFMKLSNILEIPFFTGFCFWQDIIKFNMDNINVNMIDNDGLEKTEDFEFIINNS